MQVRCGFFFAAWRPTDLTDALIREVQEDLQRDRAVAFAKRYGGWIALLVLMVIIGTAAYVGWYNWRERGRAAESEKLFAAMRNLDAGKVVPALTAFESVASETSAGVAAIARLQAAQAAGQIKKDGEANSLLEAVTTSNLDDPIVKQATEIGLLSRKIDEIDPATLMAELQPLTGADQPFRHQARELLGLAKLRAGNLKGAKTTFDEAIKDPSTPASARARLLEYSAALGKAS